MRTHHVLSRETVAWVIEFLSIYIELSGVSGLAVQLATQLSGCHMVSRMSTFKFNRQQNEVMVTTQFQGRAPQGQKRTWLNKSAPEADSDSDVSLYPASCCFRAVTCPWCM